jgi:hypothetical protein
VLVVVGGAAPVERARGWRRSSPAATSVAEALTSGLRELLTIATRSPAISGWDANTRAVSSSAGTVGTSITPVCR